VGWEGGSHSQPITQISGFAPAGKRPTPDLVEVKGEAHHHHDQAATNTTVPVGLLVVVYLHENNQYSNKGMKIRGNMQPYGEVI